jgi:hypothetical protein
MSIFRKGLHPTDPARAIARVTIESHPRVAAALKTLRGNADLSGAAPAVLNQGNSSTCWAHSAVTLLYTRRALAGAPNVALMSPLFFAQCMYAAYRAAATKAGMPLANADGTTFLEDNGAQLDDAAKCFGQWGARPFGEEQQGGGTDIKATSDENGDPIPGAIPELDPETLMAGMNATFGGEYDIGLSAPNMLDLCAAALEADIPIWTGNLVGQAYENLKAGQVCGPCPTSDTTGGGHAQAVIGYVTVSGKRQWKIRNSWGKDWCMGGDALVNDEFMAAAWSLLPFEVGA